MLPLTLHLLRRNGNYMKHVDVKNLSECEAPDSVLMILEIFLTPHLLGFVVGIGEKNPDRVCRMQFALYSGQFAEGSNQQPVNQFTNLPITACPSGRCVC